MLYILSQSIIKKIHKSFGHGLPPIQAEPGRSHVMFESSRVVQAFKAIVPRGTIHIMPQII
ncbi:MAG: hypothetical protein LBI95_01400 [Holosporales bacterium]|nr:hypothetical protein [Holosporales bacterium]